MTNSGNFAVTPLRRLRQIKLLHTLIWALVAGAILGLPVAIWFRHDRLGLGLSVLVSGECLALALNRGRCPLTDVAERYTSERSDNFDIYLPQWLARYNKRIFGTLFVAGELIWLWRWLRG
jgi:hypothetical protein